MEMLNGMIKKQKLEMEYVLYFFKQKLQFANMYSL